MSRTDRALIETAAAEASAWASDKLKTQEDALLDELRRRGMQVGVPDAEAFRAKGRPAVERLFQTEWPVTTWEAVLAQ